MTENLRNAVARVASKNRRDKESVEFQELTQLLPFSQDLCDKQDKESIVRLVIAYLRLRSYLNDDVGVHRRPAVTAKSDCSRSVRAARHQRLAAPDATGEQSPGNVQPPDDLVAGQSRDTELVQADIFTTSTATSGSLSAGDVAKDTAAPWWNAEDGEVLLQLLNRFLVLLSRKGRVLYVSRNVEEYLGVPQVWMVGRWLAEFIHPDDIKILQQQLELSADSVSVGPPPEHSRGYDFNNTRDFHLRMRHFPNGAGARRKPGNYLLVRWTGQVRTRRVGRAHGLVCLCHPVQSHALLELRMGGSMFISRHDMRLTFTYCDPRVLYLTGYDPENLIGHTVYTFHNPVDLKKCTSCHNDLIKTGTGVSQCYRFLGRTGVWVWMQTKATIVTDTRQKPQYVVCNNYILSQKEGERRHKMELQQYHLPLDLTAPGAIDLSHVTSPASSLADDDTGYSTAVSSIGSSSTSPSPQGTTPACGVDPDPLMSDGVLALGQELTDMSCAPVEEEFSPLGMARVTEGRESGRGQDQLLGSDLPLSITCSALNFGADVTVCGEQLTCDDTDPFLYSDTAVGCGDGVMEDMELLEDLLEKISDCDKTDCSQQDLAVTSLTPSPSVADVTSLEGKPPSLLRTLLDKEGQALAERPASSDTVITTTTTTSTFTSRVVCGARPLAAAAGVKGKQVELSASTKSLAEGGRRGSLSDSDNSTECASLAALPDDLLDLAMQYCDDIPDMDSPMPDALPCLESDAWGAAMEDLIPDTPEPVTSPSSGKNLVPVTDKVTSVVVVVEPSKQGLGTHKLGIGLEGKVGEDLGPISSKPLAVIQSAVVSSTQQAADKARGAGEGAGKRVTILPTVFTKGASTAVSVGGVVRGSTETSQTLSPVLSDHQYSTARAPSPKCGAAAACGKRACPQLSKAGVGPHTVRTQQQQQQQPALKIVRKSPHSAGDKETASAHVSANATSCQRQQRPPNITVQVSVPVNGGGKPLTAMSELEKHLRGLVAPPLERSKDSDGTDDEMWEDGRPARPFLERLLTGEMSHERYRQIDYQLLYQERERRMSETSATGHCSS